MGLISAIILLFFVMDPLGNVPLFLSALKPVEPNKRLKIVTRELLIAYFLLVIFLFLGRALLKTLGISEPALTIAGGIILFLISLKMIFPSHNGLAENFDGEPFIVPLAVPYVAGPSTFATVLLMTSKEPNRIVEWLIALTISWILSAAILLGGSKLSSFLGEKGLTAIERLMGMLLVSSSVQMFLDGVEKIIKNNI